uniref:WD repeat-containing protein 44 n=1 Tax=Bursaphelenchus xylophilus TaxID=6326 RepID=A0A1I7SFA5_BURXY
MFVYFYYRNVIMRCSESDAEFEDAVESLDVFPGNSSFNVEPVNSVNRRNRLANLRTRMRSEFGLASSNFGGSQTSFDDISQSDCTSIASWGRKLLNETSATSPVSVEPIDSISTRAPQIIEQYQSVPPPSHPPPPPPSVPFNSHQNRPLPPPVPPRPSPLKMDSVPLTSSDPTSIVADNLQRGHSKSKSLDRGMSVGDKITIPVSIKSTSLNRGVSGKIVNGICEEEQRINNAQGVIHQLTLSVLSSSKDSITGNNNNNTSNGSVHHSYKEILETIPEPSTSGLYERSKNNSFSVVEEKSLASSLSPNSSKALNDTFESNDSRLQASNSHKRYSSCIVDTSRPVAGNTFKECRSVSELHRDEKRELTHMASIDPITRDVERRMSMKDHHSTMSSSGSGEGSKEESLVSIHSGVGYAKSLVKSYGNTAQVMIRGAYQKVRNMVTPRPRCTVVEREEDEASESDAASSSVSMSTSENNVKLGNRTDGPPVICRPRNLKKGPFDFSQLRVVQELNNEHTGAVWSLKFSMCGRLLATAGRDNMVRIWVLSKHLSYFTRMREKYNQGNIDSDFEKIHLQMEKKNFSQLDDDDSSLSSRKSPLDSAASAKSVSTQANSQSSGTPVFAPKPFCTYRGHTADILDLAWSPRNYFLLSSSMDNTVKLWHLTRSECLCCFQHTDFVTCIAFMPKDDRYFISGSMDGKIRLWHVPEKKVALWNEVDQVKFITAITFIRSRFVVVGTYDGRCFFYTTDQLKYHTVINVRSSRGKNARGHKITSLAVHGNHLLVTSNDSRIRMYSIDNIELISKFKGAQIERSQIRGTFSPDGKHVICGSEDCFAYIWRVADVSASYSVHNNLWERIRIHNSVVTAAVFAPKPGLIFQLLGDSDSKGILSPVKTSAGSNTKSSSSASQSNKSSEISIPSSFLASASAQASRVLNELRGNKSNTSEAKAKNLDSMGDVIVTADLNGSIKVLANPRHISYLS